MVRFAGRISRTLPQCLIDYDDRAQGHGNRARSSALATAVGGPQDGCAGVRSGAEPGWGAVVRRTSTCGLAAAASLLLLCAASTASTAGWPQSGGAPTHTAAITSPGNLSPKTAGRLALDFSVPTQGIITQSPAVVAGVVYAGSFGGRLDAMSAATGRALWSTALCDGHRPDYNSFEETTPAIGSGAAFDLSDHGVLTGIRLAAPHDAFMCVDVHGNGAGNGFSPTLAGGVVYLTLGSRIAAVSAATGSVLWTHLLPSGYQVASDAVVDAGTVYVAVNSATAPFGHVFAYRAADGGFLWGVDRFEWVATLAANAGRVITGGGVVEAWDETTGALDWVGGFRGPDAVSVVGNRVVVAGFEATPREGDLGALDAATGALVWSVGVGSEEESQPSVGGGLTFLVDLDTGRLFVHRLADGHLLTSVTHPGQRYDGLATPVVVDGHIYLFATPAGGARTTLDRWSAA
jgi:hypothetical protein